MVKSLNPNDMIGNRYGRLVVLNYEYKKGHNYYYRCKCDCGNEKIVSRTNLIGGHTKSCGCFRRETASGRRVKSTEYEYRGKTYNTLSELADAYWGYKEWLWGMIMMGSDLDGVMVIPYREKVYEYKGKTYRHLSELVREYNVSYSVVNRRLLNGWSLEMSISVPSSSYYHKNTLKQSDAEILRLAKEYGVCYGTLKARLLKGMSLEKALNTLSKRGCEYGV